MDKTVHFVFYKGDLIQFPFAGTNELVPRLQKRYRLKFYDKADPGTIQPAPGDVLIGWPNQHRSKTIFNNSFKQPGWARRIVFCSFAHGLVHQMARMVPFIEEADLFLAICGKYWPDTNTQSSPFSHWNYKLIQCDLAVNRQHFPLLKPKFNPPGKRRFLYIGRQSPSDYKGVDFLCRLVDANPSLHFGWIGLGKMSSSHLIPYGLHDFSHPESRDLVSHYDFLITCGRADPNPTTILEAASWGLIPVATLQSGYYEDDWLVNIPLDDVKGSSQILQRLNLCSEEELLKRQASGFAKLDSHYHWDRLAQQVIDAIERPLPLAPSDPLWLKRKRNNLARIRRGVLRHRPQDLISILRRLPGWLIRKGGRALFGNGWNYHIPKKAFFNSESSVIQIPVPKH